MFFKSQSYFYCNCCHYEQLFFSGAIRTVNLLDYETMPQIQFHVRVSDRGKPKLTSEVLAEVTINITDVNDCAPQFSQVEYNSTLLLPSYPNVAVLQVSHRIPYVTPFTK